MIWLPWGWWLWPAGEEHGGVVVELAVLVLEHGVDESADGFGDGVLGGSFTFEEVGEALVAEEGPAAMASFGDAVGMQDYPVAGLATAVVRRCRCLLRLPNTSTWVQSPPPAGARCAAVRHRGARSPARRRCLRHPHHINAGSLAC